MDQTFQDWLFIRGESDINFEVGIVIFVMIVNKHAHIVL